MVQSNVVTRFDTVVSVMTEAEARECIREIKDHLDGARAAVLRLYEGRGWEKLGYATWRECAVAELGGHERELYRALEAAQVEQNIRPLLTNLSKTIPESQLRPMARLTPMEQPIAWQEANERSNGKPTARVVEQVVKEMRNDAPDSAEAADLDLDEWQDDALDPPADPIEIPLPKPMAVHFSSATPEWYTPRHVIERVLHLFGEIDLDPCSNAKGAAANVPACDHYTQADDGLAQQWHGRVYMNPPYGDEIGQWTAHLLQAYADGEIDEAIALLPARTDTAWFRPLMAHRCCFVHGRLRFSESKDSAPFPSVIVYLGPDGENFIEYFSDIGTIMQKSEAA